MGIGCESGQSTGRPHLTGIIFALLPLVHPGDLRPDAGFSLTLYYLITGILILAGGLIILSYRKREKTVSHG